MRYEKNQRCPDEARDSFGRLELAIMGLYLWIPLVIIGSKLI
tara:strand:+ start:387 stop:512 length:126 start_codon:yes stop_codon:yes gene_type:complete